MKPTSRTPSPLPPVAPHFPKYYYDTHRICLTLKNCSAPCSREIERRVGTPARGSIALETRNFQLENFFLARSLRLLFPCSLSLSLSTFPRFFVSTPTAPACFRVYSKRFFFHASVTTQMLIIAGETFPRCSKKFVV